MIVAPSHITVEMPTMAPIDKTVLAWIMIKVVRAVIPIPNIQICFVLRIKPCFQIMKGPTPIIITSRPIIGLKVASKKGGPTVIFIPVVISSAIG